MTQEPELVKVTFSVNGSEKTVHVEARGTLLDTLRDVLNLTGTKKGCDEAVCGACTVLIDGKPICSCTIFAVEAQNSKITTIEGLSNNPKTGSYEGLDPIQTAFILNDGFQCGFCTAGQIISAKGFLLELREKRRQNRTLESSDFESQIKEALSGNLCRCGCYNGIVEAVKSLALNSLNE